MKNIFVTGTDTNIGKTVLSLLIMQYCFKTGMRPFYLKPFQTGCNNALDSDSDARFIYSNISQLKERDPADSVIYCFKNPKAPLFAARDENISPDLNRINTILLEKNKSHKPVVIEGAGGLLVPVTENTSMIDLAQTFNAKTVLAARAGLGTINHTLLSLEAMKNRGISDPVVVFLNPKNDPVSDIMVKENCKAIEIFSAARVAGVISHIDDFSNPAPSCLKIIEKIISP